MVHMYSVIGQSLAQAHELLPPTSSGFSLPLIAPPSPVYTSSFEAKTETHILGLCPGVG